MFLPGSGSVQCQHTDGDLTVESKFDLQLRRGNTARAFRIGESHHKRYTTILASPKPSNLIDLVPRATAVRLRMSMFLLVIIQYFKM